MRTWNWIAGLVILALAGAATAQRPGPGQGRGPGGPPPNRPGGPMQERGFRLLRGVMDAYHGIRFTGKRVTLTRAGDEPLLNTEFIWKDGPRFRVEFEEGSPNHGQVIVTDGQRRQHFFPQTNEIQVFRSKMDDPIRPLIDGMRGMPGVRSEVAGGGEIAGFPTVLITIRDPQGNVMNRAWVDEAHNMILKREIFDPTGRKVGMYEFQRINYRPSFGDDDFRINKRGAKIVSSVEVVKAQAKQAGVIARGLPESSGFTLENVRLIRGAEPILMQHYVSEQGRLTIFITKSEIQPERLRRLAGGRAAVRQVKLGGDRIILIGDVQPERLERLSNSLVTL